MKPLAIFDLDGTLSDDRHRQRLLPSQKKLLEAPLKEISSLYDDYHFRLAHDEPIWPTINFLKSTSKTHRIVIMTARPVRFQGQTLEWIARHGINSSPITSILMRDDMDISSSPTLKKKLLESSGLLRPHPDNFAVDDRSDVIEMFSKMGLTTYQIQH